MIKVIGKNIDSIIQKILKESNNKYKSTILKQTTEFMEEDKFNIE